MFCRSIPRNKWKMHKIKKKAESRNVFLEMRKERMEKPKFT